MGTVREEITPAIAEFIAAQPIFFVATAPSGDDGRVNLSPKGLDTFAVLGACPPVTRAGIASSSDVGASPLADPGKRRVLTTKSSSATHPGLRLLLCHSRGRIPAAYLDLITPGFNVRDRNHRYAQRAGFAGPNVACRRRRRVGGAHEGGPPPS